MTNETLVEVRDVLKELSNKLEEKTCLVCGNVFEGKGSKYCSAKCRSMGNKQYQDRYRREGYSSNYKLRFAILYRDEFRCQYCGNTPQDGVKLHIDHIIPKSKGGTDDIDNLITSCQICNWGKTDVLLDEKPVVKISAKAFEILSQEVLSRKKLRELGIAQEYQRFLKLQNSV